MGIYLLAVNLRYVPAGRMNLFVFVPTTAARAAVSSSYKACTVASHLTAKLRPDRSLRTRTRTSQIQQRCLVLNHQSSDIWPDSPVTVPAAASAATTTAASVATAAATTTSAVAAPAPAVSATAASAWLRRLAAVALTARGEAVVAAAGTIPVVAL